MTSHTTKPVLGTDGDSDSKILTPVLHALINFGSILICQDYYQGENQERRNKIQINERAPAHTKQTAQSHK